MVLCGLLAWFVLDLRWTANRWSQSTDTMATYPLVVGTQLEFGDDASIRRLVEVARPYIEHPEVRTMFIAEGDNMQFQLLRAKYHALPARVFIYGRGLSKLPTTVPNFILLLKQRYSPPGHQSITPAAYLENLRRRKGLYFSPVLDTPDGFLVRVSREPFLPGTAQ
jgi:hypothetical protein